MEDNANKDTMSQQKNDAARSPESLQVPPSLLPAVLYRLGLTPEQTQQESSVEEAIVKLKSHDWEERAKAVRLLGRLAVVPEKSEELGELLESALDDEDSAVRAAAIHAMGNVGKYAPLPRLVRALHDSDWHVRETAVFVLGKQGPGVPDEVFRTALYDPDHSVREAARYALHQRVSPVEASAGYGQLQEKNVMQQDSEVVQTTSQEGRSSYETIPQEAVPLLVLREQSQAYAPQEQIPYTYSADMSPGEKITDTSARRSSKKWWIIIPLVALCIFVVGTIFGGLVVGVSAVKRSETASPARQFVQPQPANDLGGLFNRAEYGNMLEQEVSSGLNLTQEQVTARLQMGENITDIALAQGISVDQLRKIETGAFTNTLQTMVKAGDASQPEADAWRVRNLSNPKQMDALTSMIFLSTPVSGGN